MSDYNKYTDQELMVLIREQKQTANIAFDIIYQRYQYKLRSLCIFLSDNNQEYAKELFQEAWLNFHQTIIKSDKLKKIIMPCYLFTIVKNINLNNKKSFNTNSIEIVQDLEKDILINELDLQGSIEENDLLNMIHLVVDQLDLIYKEPFVLKWFVGLSYQEIAKVTGESADCIRKRISRAFSQVITILDPIINEIKRSK